MSLTYRIGDVFDRLAEIPDGTIDLIVTSPPFLALRSYLPEDHPDKAKEIGSEPTPAEFIDTLLALSAEWGRVLAPHGSICVELGDTFDGRRDRSSDEGSRRSCITSRPKSGSGGVGGDYNANGLREGQGKADGSAKRGRDSPQDGSSERITKFDKVSDGRGSGIRNMDGKVHGGGNGWPLAKSLTGIPTLYPWSLAYGRNLLTGADSPAGQWRIRNVIVWARPNPQVGALGDKFRPATSYITVACKSAKRYFDLDAVRGANTPNTTPRAGAKEIANSSRGTTTRGTGDNPAGAPPLDWHADDHPEDGDWLWKMSTQRYSGSHYATYPLALPTKLIKAMCPQRVCVTCGTPSTRIVGDAEYVASATNRGGALLADQERVAEGVNQWVGSGGASASVVRQAPTLGWTDCGCSTDGTHWRTGVVLDPFGGSGTTGVAAQAVGRDCIMIDLDERNADLARERCGMFLDVQPAP